MLVSLVIPTIDLLHRLIITVTMVFIVNVIMMDIMFMILHIFIHQL
jgi:hypothetical protein